MSMMSSDEFFALCRTGAEQQVRDAIKAGFDVNASSEGAFDGGMTSLHHAASAGKPALVALLIEAGADVNARDNFGRTPLLWASMGGPAKAVEALLKAGADVNAADEEGKTALIWAAERSSRPRPLRTLIEAGADLHARAAKGCLAGMTALMTAAKTNNLKVVSTLIDAGSDVQARLEAGMTTSVDMGEEVVHPTLNSGTTALMLAALENERPEVIGLLLKAGLDVNARDEAGVTALMLAARWNGPKIVDALLAGGADVAAADNEGKRAAGHAKENERLSGKYIRERLGG